MKTLAVRLDDEVMNLLTIVSQLEGTSLVDQVREAVTGHLERKMTEGDLSVRAQAALDDIDREAAARKEAIGSLLGNLPKSTGTPSKSRTRRGQSGEAEGRLPESRPMGFQPAARRGTDREHR